MDVERDRFAERFLANSINRRLFLSGTAGFALAAFLAACGGDDEDDEPEATSTTAAPAASEPTATTAAAAEPTEPAAAEPTATEAPASGSPDTQATSPTGSIQAFDNPPPGSPSGNKPDELIIAWGQYQLGTYGLDPLRHSGRVAESQLRHIYEPLVRFEDDFSTIVPALATEWERLDDLTMQFKLRQGVKFHNGEDFNAEAVRFSIMYPLSDETAGELRSSRYGSIDSVEIVDDYTVNIITKFPDPSLLGRLAAGFHTNIIAPGWATEGGQDAITREAVGTGPYRLVSWSPNEDLVVEANEEYWDGAPEIKRVRMTTITEASTRVAALRAGDVHIANPIPPEDAQNITADGHSRIIKQMANRSAFFWITVDVEPFNDPRVRQALNYAANIDGIIDAILLGEAVRLSTTVPTFAFGFDPTLEPYPFDPEKAKQLLAEAGYPDGIDIDIWYIEGRIPKDREVAEAMAQEFAKSNIRCTPQLRENSVLTELMRAKECPGLIFGSWGNAYADADDSLTPLFGCGEALARNDWTRPYGCNEDLEAILEAERTELDPDRRQELLAQAQRLMYDDAAALFQYLTVDLYGVNNWVLFQPRPDQMVWAHRMSWNE